MRVEPHDVVLKKMDRIIQTTPNKNPIMDRWISLANQRLNKMYDKNNSWEIIGASMALLEKYEKKFGAFTPRLKAVIKKSND